MRTVVRLSFALLSLVLAPTLVFAQASITGSGERQLGRGSAGRDRRSGEPRADRKGPIGRDRRQRSVPDRRSPARTVRCHLQPDGFSTVKREGIELTGSFAATVNVELKVGAVSETITVSGESPIVDVVNAKQQSTVTQRNHQRDSDRASVSQPRDAGPRRDAVGIAGRRRAGRSGHGHVRHARGTGQRRPADRRRVVARRVVERHRRVVHGRRRRQRSGSRVHHGRRVGRIRSRRPVDEPGAAAGRQHRSSGSFFANWANDSLQTSNYTEAIQAAGLRAPNLMTKIWDVNGAVGGPIGKTGCGFSPPPAIRAIGSWWPGCSTIRTPAISTPGPMWPTDHAGDRRWHVEERERPADVAGVPAQQVQLLLGRAAAVHVVHRAAAARRPRRKRAATTTRVRACSRRRGRRRVTSRLLLEAGLGGEPDRRLRHARRNLPNYKALIPVTEQCTAGCAANGGIAGLQYRGNNSYVADSDVYSWRASASFVTGPDNAKFGYQGQFDRQPLSRTRS